MSWIDALVRAIDRRGIPPWALFFGLFVFLTGGIAVGHWTDGSATFPEVHPASFNGFYLPAALVAYGVLTRAAGRALDRITPVLEDADIPRARRQLTSMPQWQAIASFLIGAAVAGALMLWVPAYTANVASPSMPTLITGVVGFCVSYGVTTVAAWQSLRIIAAVVGLHRRVEKVDLFRPGPAHAFAPVTAGIGVYLVSGMTVTALTNPASLGSPATIALIVGAVLAASAAFVLPLIAMRSRLADEKRELLDDNARREGETVDALHAAIAAGEYDKASTISDALTALATRRDRIRRASTVPWEARIGTGFATTVLTPVVVWLITALIGRLLEG
jgi:hypothetical protein